MGGAPMFALQNPNGPLISSACSALTVPAIGIVSRKAIETRRLDDFVAIDT